MEIQKIMSTDVDAIEPQSTIQEAAWKMKNRDIGSLPVLEGGKPLGMVTDRDIAIRAVAEGRDPVVARVAEVMSRQVVFCYEDQETSEVARLMSQHQIRRIPVLNHREELVGIVSLGDLAVDSMSQTSAAKALSEISKSSDS